MVAGWIHTATRAKLNAIARWLAVAVPPLTVGVPGGTPTPIETPPISHTYRLYVTPVWGSTTPPNSNLGGSPGVLGNGYGGLLGGMGVLVFKRQLRSQTQT